MLVQGLLLNRIGNNPGFYLIISIVNPYLFVSIWVSISITPQSSTSAVSGKHLIVSIAAEGGVGE